MIEMIEATADKRNGQIAHVNNYITEVSLLDGKQLST